MNAGRITLAAALLVAAAFAATAWPLLTWSLTLAALGLPHVLVEWRFVDQRFGARIGGSVAIAIGLLLLAIVVVRTLGIAQVGHFGARATIELLLVIALAATVLPITLRASTLGGAIGALTIAVLGIGVAIAPLDTLVVLAFLHNLTPVGLLAERLRGKERRLAMLACILVFAIVPLLIASGLPGRWLLSLGVGATGTTVLGTGSLDANTGTFVPSFVSAPRAADLFSCAAFLQCMHYVVVLGVLPKLGPGAISRPWLAWPAPRRFGAIVAMLGGLLLFAFALAFHDARAVYGVFAATHAWLEVPVLLLAAGGITAAAPPLRA